MRRATQSLTALAATIGIYAAVVRPRLLRWGTTDAELRAPYPGAGLIPEGTPQRDDGRDPR